MLTAARNGGSARDAEKEAFWRETLKRWRISGESQASFCRMEQLNQNTFSSWKKIIPERDAEDAATKSRSNGKRAAAAASSPGSAGASKPSFVKLEVESATNSTEGTTYREPSPPLAAELILPSNSCRLRIYNGADQLTIAALVAALALN